MFAKVEMFSSGLPPFVNGSAKEPFVTYQDFAVIHTSDRRISNVVNIFDAVHNHLTLNNVVLLNHTEMLMVMMRNMVMMIRNMVVVVRNVVVVVRNVLMLWFLRIFKRLCASLVKSSPRWPRVFSIINSGELRLGLKKGVLEQTLGSH
eukprot:TRINITY_DN11783_c0_g1_i1.p2 TRINITY_DN11783_c0_g1~~TRINITY_DN11783_c0_g1_i1.p2  ORF type:complete len:148 (-),score=22.47 TRINITY_DN11783_c0_g1_i1:116-559(-)